MLDVLRASKGGIITWIFLAAIIVIFVVSFGPGSLVRGDRESGCGGRASYAARVNGETVPVLVFQRQYAPIADQYERNPATAPMLPYLATQVLTRIVDTTLLSQEAERRGIQVTSEDLSRRLWQEPAYQVDGKFNLEKYKALAARQWGSVTDFERVMKRDMRLERLQAVLSGSIRVTEAEVHDTWKLLSDTYDVSYVLFPTVDARAEVKVADADAAAFAAKEGARIEKFYKDNAARYDQPEKVRARHILARIEGKDEAGARKRIDAAVARLQKGEDFAKVAAEVSDDVNTKASGGDLGVITAGQVDEAFSKAALALKAGQLSEPVKTPAGWHVIKVDEVVPARKIPLETARLDIARELLSGDRAAALVKEKAEAALKAAQAGKALTELYPQQRPAIPASEGQPAQAEVKAALTWGGKAVEARETGSVPASAPEIPGLQGAGALLQDVLAAQKGAVLPKVYDLPAGAVVLVVKDRAHPDESKYAAERHAHELAIRGEKLRQLETTWLEQLRAKAKIDVNPALIPQTRNMQGQPEEG